MTSEYTSMVDFPIARLCGQRLKITGRFSDSYYVEFENPDLQHIGILPKSWIVPFNANSYFSDALGMQVGGDHYSKHVIQPIEFSMVNQWDACAHSILKYVLRWRDKDGEQDLRKALHFVSLRRSLGIWDTKKQPVAIQQFNAFNKLDQATSNIMIQLEQCVMRPTETAYATLTSRIEQMRHRAQAGLA